MQKKLNESFIETYSEDFSNEVISAYFEDKHSISGKEILNLSPSRQVNMFVLMILFRKWQDEIKALESPYFDYKNPEVRKAMIQFMNVLSQHIEVGATDLHPLLAQAVKQTILLALDPVAYLKLEFESQEGTAVTEKVTQPILKYIKLHKEDLQQFAQINIPSSTEEFINAAKDYFEDFDTSEVLIDQLQKLSEVLQINEDDLFESQEEELPVFESEEIDGSSSDEISFFDQDLDEEDESEAEEELEEKKSELKPEEVEEEPVEYEEKRSSQSSVISEDLEEDDVEIEDDDIELIEFDDEEQETTDETEEIEETEEKTVAAPEEDEEEEDDDEEGTVNSRFSKPSATLNETYGNKKEDETLGDQLEKRKVNSIMDAISINNRYMFTKELFKDDKETFVNAINELESMNSFDEAVEKLIHSYAKTYGWDMNSPEVKELLKVVFRRFR